MPKMKTRRAAAKRFQIRKGGSIKCKHANRRHLLEHKSRKRKRQLRNPMGIAQVDVHRIYGQLPNG
jgi:large subunit ribosomal protein L35